jgi:zinc transport system ATP-binding protein
MNILEVKSLTSSYNGFKAIEDVNFKVKEKEYICIVGENGSGKSTLVKTIVGLQSKDKGTIKLKLKPDEISYLSQSSLKDLSFPATVKEIILSGTQKHKKGFFYTKEDKEEVNRVCKLFGITDLLHKRIGSLSGGQRQRVMLARALCKHPKLLILDEPCSGLDSNISKELYKILSDLNKNQGITIIMVTHDLNEIKNYATRIIMLNRTVKYDGSVEDWKGI